jgi:peptidoglycan/LPS O-acetylase OafA/YrhL
MKNPPPLAPSQSTYLDFVRAGAAFLVLIGHAAQFFWMKSSIISLPLQNAGVMIFFLMSGFLISYTVFSKWNNANYTFKTFFIDRFCRIYCAYLPALFFVLFVDTFTKTLTGIPKVRVDELKVLIDMQNNSGLVSFLGNFFMMQNFPFFQILRIIGVPDNLTFIRPFGSGSPFWTISIEWWIYMLFGFIALKFFRDKKPFPIWLILVSLFVTAEPFYYLIGGTNNCLTLLWLLGMLFALLFIYLPDYETRLKFYFKTYNLKNVALAFFWGSFLCLVGRCVSIKLDTGKLAIGEFQFGLFLGFFLFSGLFLFPFRDPPIWVSKTFRFFADFSYSLYLTHYSVLVALYCFFPGHDHNFLFYLFAMLISIAVAILFWLIFEKHYRILAARLKGF